MYVDGEWRFFRSSEISLPLDIQCVTDTGFQGILRARVAKLLGMIAGMLEHQKTSVDSLDSLPHAKKSKLY